MNPQLNVRIPDPLRTRLRAYCAAYGVSVSSFVRESLIRSLEARDPKAQTLNPSTSRTSSSQEPR